MIFTRWAIAIVFYLVFFSSSFRWSMALAANTPAHPPSAEQGEEEYHPSVEKGAKKPVQSHSNENLHSDGKNLTTPDHDPPKATDSEKEKSSSPSPVAEDSKSGKMKPHAMASEEIKKGSGFIWFGVVFLLLLAGIYLFT